MLVSVLLSLLLFSPSLEQILDKEFAKVVYVNKKGRNGEDCLQGNSTQLVNQPSIDKSCRTIEYVADKIGNVFEEIKIIIATDIKVRRTARFQRGGKIIIAGENKKSKKFTCNCQRNVSGIKGGGFTFVNVQEIHIYNVSFVNCCGSLNSKFNASIVIHESSNITMESVTVRDNAHNSGIILIDCSKMIRIVNSAFLRNIYKVQPLAPLNSSFAAGVHMQFSRNRQLNISVINCHFKENDSPIYRALDPDATKGQFNLNGYSLGGGMGVVFTQKSNWTVIEIHNATFEGNTANHGGGLCVHFQDEPSNNYVTVDNSLFIGNKARVGGGALKLSFGLNQSAWTQNIFSFKNVTFEKNSARFGGGLSVSMLLTNSRHVVHEAIRFQNCTWRANFGLYGPAIELSPFRFQHSRQLGGYLPIPLFKDCVISDHFIKSIKPKKSKVFHVTQGVLAITRFTVHFEGTQIFRNNTYSAIYLTSGRAVFKPYSEVLFSNNVGLRGGAISANGFSTIVMNDNSQFRFFNNSAIDIGGAIYYASSDQREYFEGRSCFLEYAGSEHDLTRRNLSLNFTNNRAQRGLAIYSASLFTCYFAYIGRFNNNIFELLDSIGSFSFDVSIAEALATGIRNVNFGDSSVMSVIPGKLLHLPLGMADEFDSYVKSGYKVRVNEKKNYARNVSLSNYFTISNSTRVYGTPNTSTELILSTPQEIYSIEYSVKVNFLSCPPGFYFDQMDKKCSCSADTPNFSYPSIPKCDYSSFRAYVYYGFWVGYYPASEAGNPDSLYTAPFPFSHNNYGNFLLLPNSTAKLSQFMCGNNRKGTLCGKCIDGFSTYYHSKQFKCGENTHCKFGILFYLFSDILSLTIFFTIVIVFGVSLSSGSLNGLVFFSQFLDLFSPEETLQLSVLQNKALEILHNGYQIIYGIFNLEFFSIFSFCLLKGATILDILLFKYFTTFFAFLLIVLIVFLANCPKGILKGICGRFKLCQTQCTVSLKSSMIHGITTLLIVSYSQCTKSTFSILKTVYLRSKPNLKPVLVTYYGGLPYFEGRHLIYAIPAIIVCLTVVTLPPLFLLLYPSALHLLSLCNLSEHRVTHRFFTRVGINRLMPLFDSLQACYKDKLRFFSGLYFIYRIVLLLAFTFGEVKFYLVSQFLLLFMLGVHSIAQPYRLHKHNIFDGLIFLNLAAINGITVIIKLATTTEFVNFEQKDMIFILTAQTVLAYLPIVVVSLFGTQKLIAKCVSQRAKLKSIANLNISCDQEEHRGAVGTDISHTSIELTEPLLL